MPDQEALRRYDHRRHAGNAGDVWKHFVLAEAAGYLLRERGSLAYVESHAGFPEYRLESGGEWEKGIGRCWDSILLLQDFLYFRILFEINGPHLQLYPGSALLVQRAAAISTASARVVLWDIDPQVHKSWLDRPARDKDIHLGDGYSGAASVLDRLSPGLLLIDPPYTEEQDVIRAIDLAKRAEEAGWVVLCWHFLKSASFSSLSEERYPLDFAQVGLQGGRWAGAEMALAGADRSLKAYLRRRCSGFVQAMKDRGSKYSKDAIT